MEILEKFKLSNLQKEQFQTYYQELVDYNEKVNLTAITDKEEVFIKHFYDSLLGVDYIPQNASVVDIGTGAGFPGLPLKIAREDISLTLVDSLNKRIEFLKYLTNKIDIKCECIHSRAEDFASVKREVFDVAVSRAVANLSTLCEYTLPLVKIGGLFISYKGSNIDEELNSAKKAISILGGKIKEIIKLSLPNDLGERNLIIIEKIKNTPTQYPRKGNLPKSRPIV